MRDGHQRALDGLRGVAAFMVVIFHMDAFFGSLFSPSDKYISIRRCGNSTAASSMVIS